MVSVRPGRPEDARQIVDFQLRLAMETENLPLDPEVVAKGVAAVFSGKAEGRYWIAEVDGEVAGCTLTLPEWSDWRNGTVLWIHSVYVRREFRRRGVFRGIYEHLKRMVEADESLRGLRLYVEKGNTPAKRTYRTLGMDGSHYQMYEWLK
jgi:GNAT superfamily N-acetyltransferase